LSDLDILFDKIQKEVFLDKISIRMDELENILDFHPEFKSSVFAEIRILKKLLKSIEAENYSEAKSFIEERKFYLFNEL